MAKRLLRSPRIERGASEEIKEGRKLAFDHHPDRNPATAMPRRFKEATEAYRLREPKRRAHEHRRTFRRRRRRGRISGFGRCAARPCATSGRFGASAT
jgi:DnaJ-class molecular chaperone